MRIDSHRNGVLRIWMTDADMARWGLAWESMIEGDGVTDRTLRRLLCVARRYRPAVRTGQVLVEAVPLYGGCLLLFSEPSARVYRLETADDVMQLAAALNTVSDNALPPASLYREGDRYLLIVYGTLSLVDEFAAPCGEGELAVSRAQEHGMPLIVGCALTRLRASGGSH